MKRVTLTLLSLFALCTVYAQSLPIASHAFLENNSKYNKLEKVAHKYELPGVLYYIYVLEKTGKIITIEKVSLY